LDDPSTSPLTFFCDFVAIAVAFFQDKAAGFGQDLVVTGSPSSPLEIWMN
jgi:hypothetical protein